MSLEKPKFSIKRILKHPGSWVSVTYFAEGFPYNLIHSVAEILFKEFGASLEAIGMTSLFHLPWNLKFLWGPFLDKFATKRKWIIWIEILISLAILFLAFSTTTDYVLLAATWIFIILAFLSATHDIAIDGFYLEILNKDDQSKYVGIRAMAYRIATFVIAGPVVYIIGSTKNWFAGLLFAAAVMAAVLLYNFLCLSKEEVQKNTFSDLFNFFLRFRTLAYALIIAGAVVFGRIIIGSEEVQGFTSSNAILSKLSATDWIGIILVFVLIAGTCFIPAIKRYLKRSNSFYADAFVDFLDQKNIGSILAFIILFRTGESFLLKMRYAFLRDIGVTMEEFSIAAGMIALVGSFAATMIGGYLISKQGIARWKWPFLISQNLLNLLYMFLAYKYGAFIGHPELGHANFYIVSVVIALESIGAGFGTALFMVYIMRCCKPKYKAAHMAIVTALMSIGFTFAGVASGYLADLLGFTSYFGFTFLATIPAMLLAFFVPYLDGSSAADPLKGQAQ